MGSAYDPNKQHGGKFAVFGFGFPLRNTPDNRSARFQASLKCFAQCEWNVFHSGRASLTDIATWDFVSQTQNLQTCASLGFQSTKKQWMRFN